MLEATGTVSVRATSLPLAAFAVADSPVACRLSDDYWLSHHMRSAGIALALLPSCQYDFVGSRWPPSCGHFQPLHELGAIDALSSRKLAPNGVAESGTGDWRDQLRRYERCQELLLLPSGRLKRWHGDVPRRLVRNGARARGAGVGRGVTP